MSKAPRTIKGGRAPQKAPRSQNKLVTAVVVTAFVATIASASAVILFQKLVEADPSSVPVETVAAAPAPSAPRHDKLYYYEFPKMSVFLKKTGKGPVGFANIRVSAEFTDATPLQSAKMAQPRIVDAMQQHLRDCSREDLDGRKGTDQLRQAFLTIVNDAIAPHQANAVLFREIVIQ